MEIKGKLVKVLDAQTGQGRNGEWKRQEFIIELEGMYPRKVCIAGWGEKVNVEYLRGKEGSMLDVQFDIESREFNGKWYTNLTAFKVDVEGGIQPQNQMSSQGPVDVYQPEMDTASEKDDLPF
jgi:hypothetical protein